MPRLPICNIDEGFLNGDLNCINTKGVNYTDVFRKLGIIAESYGFIPYNYGTYEYVKFDLDKLKEYDPKGVEEFYKLQKKDKDVDKIDPFRLCKHNDGTVAVLLDYDNFWYDWENETKKFQSEYGDGHCYEYLFKDYLLKHHKSLCDKLNYDSESGMFCVYCENMKDAKKVASILSKIYNDKNKMLELIRKTKEKHGIIFIDIKI